MPVDVVHGRIVPRGIVHLKQIYYNSSSFYSALLNFFSFYTQYHLTWAGTCISMSIVTCHNNVNLLYYIEEENFRIPQANPQCLGSHSCSPPKMQNKKIFQRDNFFVLIVCTFHWRLLICILPFEIFHTYRGNMRPQRWVLVGRAL